jgi:DHA3 family macrolide efflux protein-like MFS transporter
MQGRVFTLVGSLCNLATPLSMAIAGPVADAVGVRALYVVGAVAQILLGVVGFFVPAIMHVEDNNGNGHTVTEEQGAEATALAGCAETA